MQEWSYKCSGSNNLYHHQYEVLLGRISSGIVIFWKREEIKVKDFFISYNSADKSWAEWIAWTLEEAGYTTVLQAWDFRPGSNFVLEMQRAASETERTIAILSPAYRDALYTQPEWAAAFVQDPTGEKGTLIPVRVQKCDLKGLLTPIIRIDLVNLDEPAAKKALLRLSQNTID